MAYTIQQIKTALELYDKLKKVVPTVRQLGYPAVHTMYEWINQREATGGKFPDIEPLGVSKRHLKVKMNHEGFSAEHKLKILKRCFEGTESVRDVAIDEGVSRVIIYSWRRKYLREGIFGLQQKKKQIKRTKSIDEQIVDESGSNKTGSSEHSVSSEEIETLRKQVKELQMKVDVMSEVFEILKKGQGTDIDIQALKNEEKFLIISALKKKYSILSLLKHLSMSKSSYYYVEQTKKKDDKYMAVRTLLKEIFTQNYECYGYRRLHTALQKNRLLYF